MTFAWNKRRSDAPLRLKGDLLSHRLHLGALARGVGVDPSTVTRWVSGRTTPPFELRERVDRWLQERGIDPVLAWLPEEPMKDQITLPSKPNLRLVTEEEAPTVQEDPDMTICRQVLDHEDLDFFNLEDDPFTTFGQPDEIWMPSSLVRIEKAILRAIKTREIVALVGPAGAGKSTLLRRVWAAQGRNERIRLLSCASLDRKAVTSAALATAVLRDLIERNTSNMSQEERSELLRKTLLEQDANGFFPALMLDEAHHLRIDTLLAVKQLWDSHTLFRMLAVLLVGQTTLATTLRQDPRVRELAGRTHIIEMPAFGPEQVGEYLCWRFGAVHADAKRVFDAEAIRAIASRAHEPLWINNVAIAAMRYAHQIGDAKVLASHVGRV